jgi:hypothetical protein
MKTIITVSLTLLLVLVASAGEIVVQKIDGDVSVRKGIGEEWTRVATGDVLRPNDTIRTGKQGAAVIVVRWPSEQSHPKRVTLPQEVMVDLSDIRDLTQEELMLKLTLEKVRASTSQWKNDGLHIPNAGVIHGDDRSAPQPVATIGSQDGEYLLNGAKVLFENGYFATCLLKAMRVFRSYPALRENVDHRLLLAQAMERATLRGEATAEYGALLGSPGLTSSQQKLIELRLQELRR